ncbi:MAG: hypothetical protein LBC99_04045 [Spirochaetota bacterium]|jgi:uncharacterized integral membrane protein|nr:hypothetical protein [Spirochaetota bacterium]
MRWVRLILILALVVLLALFVQENANNQSSMSLFGYTLFSNISTPIIVLFSFLAGMLITIPIVFFSRFVRAHRRAKAEAASDDAKQGEAK